MPLLTTVIDDKSPLITYDNTWLPGNSWDDQLASCYYLATFTTNNVTNGAMSFNFNGTAVWVYGANRPNHGSYTVDVDGSLYSGYNGAGNNLFQQALFNLSLMDQEAHSLKLTNTATGSLYVDIDMIVWQSEVGNTGDQFIPEIVQDTDSRFQYQDSAWETASTTDINLNFFNNGSGHITETLDAIVTFTFEAVSIFGTSGPVNGQYSVQLDGGEATTYNATNAFPTNYGVMIFHADNLGSGSHQIGFTNLPSATGQYLAIDYAQLWTTNSTNTTVTPTPQNASSVQNTLSGGAIAGIAVAVAIAILSAGAAVFFYRRWKAALDGHRDPQRIYTPQQMFVGSGTMGTTGFSSSREMRNGDNASRALARRVQQPTDDSAAQTDGITQITIGSRDSRSIMDTMSLPQSPTDDDTGRRPLPEAPGGGLSLAAEFPKLSGRRVQSTTVGDSSSIAPSDAPPPNYIQATGNAPRHE